jgi:putative transmembrane protein PGPGW
MSTEPEGPVPEKHVPSRSRGEVWGDDPEERDASATIEQIAAEDPELARRWQDHPALAPFKAVGLFLGRSGKRIAVTIAGVVVLLVGIAGLALPILPGWILIFAGLAILGTEYVWAQRLLRKARETAANAANKVRRKRDEP